MEESTQLPKPKPLSTAVTRGVRVDVQSEYLKDRSAPMQGRFVFAYSIRITNQGSEVVQLRSRHWIITDAEGKVEEVRGPGVVGEQPTLRPGEAFQYNSGAILTTPRGTMTGTYQMYLPDGSHFDATIAPFALEQPFSLN